MQQLHQDPSLDFGRCAIADLEHVGHRPAVVPGTAWQDLASRSSMVHFRQELRRDQRPAVARPSAAGVWRCSGFGAIAVRHARQPLSGIVGLVPRLAESAGIDGSSRSPTSRRSCSLPALASFTRRPHHNTPNCCAEFEFPSVSRRASHHSGMWKVPGLARGVGATGERPASWQRKIPNEHDAPCPQICQGAKHLVEYDPGRGTPPLTGCSSSVTDDVKAGKYLIANTSRPWPPACVIRASAMSVAQRRPRSGDADFRPLPALPAENASAGKSGDPHHHARRRSVAEVAADHQQIGPIGRAGSRPKPSPRSFPRSKLETLPDHQSRRAEWR